MERIKSNIMMVRFLVYYYKIVPGGSVTWFTTQKYSSPYFPLFSPVHNPTFSYSPILLQDNHITGILSFKLDKMEIKA